MTIQMKADDQYFHVLLQLFVFQNFPQKDFFLQLKNFETLKRKELSCGSQRFLSLFTCFH